MSITCFYCRKSAPCLCDAQIEQITVNVLREQQDLEDDDLMDHLSPHTKVINVEYPIYE